MLSGVAIATIIATNFGSHGNEYLWLLIFDTVTHYTTLLCNLTPTPQQLSQLWEFHTASNEHYESGSSYLSCTICRIIVYTNLHDVQNSLHKTKL